VGVPRCGVSSESLAVSGHGESKVGGSPSVGSFEAWPVCSLCVGQLSFLAQIHAPVTWQRSLLVFGCNEERCHSMQSVRVYRAQDVELEFCEREIEQDVVSQDSSSQKTSCRGILSLSWGETKADGGLPSLDDLEAMLEGTDLKNHDVPASEPKVNDSKTMATSDGSAALDVVESFSNFDADYLDEKERKHALRLLEKYEKGELAQGDCREGVPYGALEPGEMCDDDDDEVEDRFQRALKTCPSQCFRYDFDGIPVLPSKKDLCRLERSSIPSCESCCAARVFECQLMPPLLWELRNSLSQTELDFMTVLVFVCPNSCGGSGTVEEVTFVF